MSRTLIVAFCVLLLTAGCQETASPELVVYSGRSKSLVDPLIAQFTAATGIEVNVRYGDTAQLAVALMEEREQSPADLYWAQDAGALGAVHALGMLAELPDSLRAKIPAVFAGGDGTWLGTSGRARTIAWSTLRSTDDERPEHLSELTDTRYRNRVGWAPTNGSFQAAITAMRKLEGDDVARAWLTDMQTNGARAYTNNRAILEGIANGEIDFGLPNHYYLYRYVAEDAAYPVAQGFFANGDPGNLVNVAGIGLLTTAKHPAAAQQFISFLLSPSSQAWFASENFEYPVVEGVPTPDLLTDSDGVALRAPDVNLDDLRDLESTLALLREVGIL